MIRVATTGAWALLLAMAAALAYGFGVGDGWAEVRTLTRFPWFNVSLVDVYVGFVLFGGWIAYRERSAAVAAAWIAGLMVLGNLVACLYVIVALRRCGGDVRRFWLGHRERVL